MEGAEDGIYFFSAQAARGVRTNFIVVAEFPQAHMAALFIGENGDAHLQLRFVQGIPRILRPAREAQDARRPHEHDARHTSAQRGGVRRDTSNCRGAVVHANHVSHPYPHNRGGPAWTAVDAAPARRDRPRNLLQGMEEAQNA